VKTAGAAALALAALALVLSGSWAWRQGKADRDLAARLALIVPAPAVAVQPCVRPGSAPATVLLVLGQPNAGNHGGEDEAPADGRGPRVSVFARGGCVRVGDPLPGGTGRHHSIWVRLPAQLQRRGFAADPVFAVLAVDATTIDDWSRRGSPLRQRLQDLLADLRAAGLRPSRVLWQHGEADTRQGTSTQDYMAGFEAVLATLRSGGVDAPVLMARSTVCRRGDGRAVKEAVAQLAAHHADLWPGPDTDLLQGADRPQGCHFSRAGLDKAAGLWADAIMQSQP
jgi:hypothetical protein